MGDGGPMGLFPQAGSRQMITTAGGGQVWVSLSCTLMQARHGRAEAAIDDAGAGLSHFLKAASLPSLPPSLPPYLCSWHAVEQASYDIDYDDRNMLDSIRQEDSEGPKDLTKQVMCPCQDSQGLWWPLTMSVCERREGGAVFLSVGTVTAEFTGTPGLSGLM